LIVRRTRIVDPAAPQLFATWDYHAFVTSLEGDETAIDAYHRRHARVEQAIRDLKEGAGLQHCPSGRFPANGAWLACAVLAHNTIRWFARLGDCHPKYQTLTVAATIRHRFLTLPGRVVNRSGTPTLRLGDQLALGQRLRPSNPKGCRTDQDPEPAPALLTEPRRVRLDRRPPHPSRQPPKSLCPLARP
jgi:hypothetical protein